ncbi:hypothetical protein V865_003861 [Kwoniella europaea PYCC6329]|uniref:Protein CPL1-like domain-containing protein n=1 Tax=Kwoniella europaea PYCC6329 TaxID=1423913 RepID=A0AAX4KIY5_9TREE
MSYTKPLSILCLASLVGMVKGMAFIGCVDPYRLRNYPVVLSEGQVDNVVDQSSCLSYCQAQEYRTGAWDSSTSTCYCTSENPPFSPYYYETAADSSGNCVVGSGHVQVYDVQTSFQFLGCRGTDVPDDAVFIDYIGFEECFDRCSASGSTYRYAYPELFTAGSGRNTECQCGPSPLTADSVTCNLNTRYLYYQDITVEPSGLSDRRRALNRLSAARRLARDQPFCPVGNTPCRIPGLHGDSYECVDVASELESCGGCMNGIYGSDNTTSTGVDCSTLPGAAFGATTCYRGSCQAWACEEGYVLEDDQCVQV